MKIASRELIICDQKRGDGRKSDITDANSERSEHQCALPEFTAIYYVFYFQKEKKIKRVTRFPMYVRVHAHAHTHTTQNI